ncbi:MAG: hypothetical protein COA74_03830 [Gammaproteobacteria bacterium]|nr:MAG: hypothetical protein COA74_03830 [Gammaproteobacteria bacterium]
MKILVSMITATLITTALVSTTSAVLAEDSFHYDYATVLQSKPVYRIIEMTKQERQCRPEEVVYKQRQRKSSNGSLVGGILGAAVGHALGHNSKHRTGATVAGALVGASIANNTNNNISFNERRVVESRCRLVPTTWEEEKIVGYKVVYRYNGRTFETRLPFEPTDSLKIRVVMTPIQDFEERSD